MMNRESGSKARLACMVVTTVLLAGCGVVQIERDPSPKREGKSSSLEPQTPRRRGGPNVCTPALHRSLAALPVAGDSVGATHAKLMEYGIAMHEYHVCLASDSAS